MYDAALRFRYLLKKFRQGDISGTELEEFWRHMAQMSDEEILSSDADHSWLYNHQKQLPVDEDRFRLIRQRIGGSIQPKERGTKVKRLIVSLAAAAVLTGVVVLGVTVFNSGSRLHPATAVSLTANRHAIRVVTLPDGSTVTLKSGSTLTYDSSFNRRLRQVKLTGEAYFDVVNDAQKPFRVSSGNYLVDVLGTAFNIKQENQAGRIEVSVARGKVSVMDKRTNAELGVLIPGNQVRVQSTGAKPGEAETIQSSNVAAEQVNEWTRQNISIKNNTWAEVAKLVEEKFGVRVQFRNRQVQDCRFTGDFADKSLDECMDIFALLTKSTWKKEGTSVIWVEGRGCD